MYLIAAFSIEYTHAYGIQHVISARIYFTSDTSKQFDLMRGHINNVGVMIEVCLVKRISGMLGIHANFTTLRCNKQWLHTNGEALNLSWLHDSGEFNINSYRADGQVCNTLTKGPYQRIYSPPSLMGNLRFE